LHALIIGRKLWAKPEAKVRIMGVRHFLFSFEGRISRLEWWEFAIPYVVFLALLYWAESSFAELGPRKTYVAIAIFVVYAVGLYMWLAVNVKRCHDRGHSGWFVLLSLIPLVNIWYVVEVCFFPGQSGPNRFGPDPKAGLAPIYSSPSRPHLKAG
jgi:uncharacterized membrane protein YhaH (DUF805 family)